MGKNTKILGSIFFVSNLISYSLIVQLANIAKILNLTLGEGPINLWDYISIPSTSIFIVVFFISIYLIFKKN